MRFLVTKKDTGYSTEQLATTVKQATTVTKLDDKGQPVMVRTFETVDIPVLKTAGCCRIYEGDAAPTTEQCDGLFTTNVKQTAKDKVKAHRAYLLSQGFNFRDKTIQTRNQVDVANINGAALNAVSNSTFTTTWITSDNTFLVLDAAGVIAMQAAMVARANTIYTTYITVLTQLATATDISGINLDFSV